MAKVGLWTVLLVCSIFFLTSTSAASEELLLEGPVEPVTEGFFQLTFTGAQNASNVVIERASTADFNDIVSQYAPMGSFNQLALSGFSSGEYYFRAQENGHTSNTVLITVQHHSLTQAFILFFIGAVMFSLLVVTILRYQGKGEGRRHA